MSQRKVVITGMGAVTAAGLGVERLWEAARDGVSGVRRAELPESNRIKHAAFVPDFAANRYLDDSVVSKIDRFAALALVAADEAIAQAGLTSQKLGPGCGVILGSGIGGLATLETGHESIFLGNRRLDPFTIPKTMPSAGASQVSMRFGAQGPSFCVSSACSSSTQAIGMAAHLVRSGAIDMAIVGGSEAMLTAGGMRAWEILRVLTPSVNRPFSKDRDGMVLGEGAAIFVIESADRAQARGASILAELAGYGTSTDAADLLRPDPAGAASAMSLAIADAGLTPSAIGYINAHGTGTVLNDMAEVTAVNSVFGSARPALSSTKPIHGHTLGAAGAIELAITVKALIAQTAPPTINWTGEDPKCPIDPVANQARPLVIAAALSNSFAFGGINASLVVRTFG